MTLIIKMHKSLVIFSLTLMLNMMVLFIFLQSWINSNLFELIHLNKNMERNERSTHWLLKILSVCMEDMVCHSGGWGVPPILWFSLTPSPPKSFPPPPWDALPHLEMKPPIWKMNSPLKHETPFLEMIPRKSTINNNLKSS